MQASNSERAIRTLMSKVQRYLTEKGAEKFYDVLQDIVANINNSYNRTIGMSANEVNKDNEAFVWNRMFAKYMEKKDKPRSPPKFNVNDLVRVSKEKLLFEKVPHLD